MDRSCSEAGGREARQWLRLERKAPAMETILSLKVLHPAALQRAQPESAVRRTLGKRGFIRRGARSLGSGGLRRWFSCKYLDICCKNRLASHPDSQVPRIHANKSALP